MVLSQREPGTHTHIHAPQAATQSHTRTHIGAELVIACKQHTLFRQRCLRTHIGYSHFKSTGSTCFSPTEPRTHTRRCVHSLTLCLFSRLGSRPASAVRVSLALFRQRWSVTASRSPEKSRGSTLLPLAPFHPCHRFCK